MAAALRRLPKRTFWRCFEPHRGLSSQSLPRSSNLVYKIAGTSAGVLLSLYLVHKTREKSGKLYVIAEEQTKQQRKAALVQTQRELRFLAFASVEFEGNLYMTPRDFLESIKEEIPRPRAGRSTLDRRSVERYLRNTPSRAKGSTSLFRDLHDNGLVSYTEYLFLLCVLTKPRSGFQIAFNMFDTDGNQRVDKHEFLVLSSILIQQHAIKDGTIGAPLGDTTLTVHFFGQRGYDVLKYEDFHRFMDNLQTEVLQLEFNEFSHGMQTISEVDFARILLRYTILTKEETDDYLERMRQRIPDSKGITFQDFKEFGQFLNNLDDFALAMRIFTFANASISESDFQRSVKAVTGHTLNKHLVHVVFQLFDVDGDGKLSHKEFISVMKDRLHRGFRSSLVPTSKWDEFKMCVKNELKQS